VLYIVLPFYGDLKLLIFAELARRLLTVSHLTRTVINHCTASLYVIVMTNKLQHRSSSAVRRRRSID